jgi:hypothetical protein
MIALQWILGNDVSIILHVNMTHISKLCLEEWTAAWGDEVCIKHEYASRGFILLF